jgi:glycosyl transferase family 2
LARSFVSVLIDTYNHERFIEQAIVSVLEQDFPEAEREVIVVDDGSTDRTPEIVRKFEPRVRLLRKANGGQASAFNAAIPECQGEIVAFLDGDDWWAPGKLSAVVAALCADQSLGLIGHGITEMFSDGRQNSELLKENPRFRIDSEKNARLFRLRKSFLGTSRMSYRADLLRQIGKVPETLIFEADEYLFTIGALLSDVLILRDSFTFYRIHGSNAFQLGDGSASSARRKQKVLEALAESLGTKLKEMHAPGNLEEIVVGWVKLEADLLRLSMDRGFPWETVTAELRNYRVMQENASPSRILLKCLSLLPACFMPSRSYYSLIRRITSSGRYRKAREKWLPFSQPKHVDRFRATGP